MSTPTMCDICQTEAATECDDGDALCRLCHWRRYHRRRYTCEGCGRKRERIALTEQGGLLLCATCAEPATPLPMSAQPVVEPCELCTTMLEPHLLRTDQAGRRICVQCRLNQTRRKKVPA